MISPRGLLPAVLLAGVAAKPSPLFAAGPLPPDTGPGALGGGRTGVGDGAPPPIPGWGGKRGSVVGMFPAPGLGGGGEGTAVSAGAGLGGVCGPSVTATGPAPPVPCVGRTPESGAGAGTLPAPGLIGKGEGT